MASRLSFSLFVHALFVAFVSASDSNSVYFDYGAAGPQKWGSLNSLFAACSKGKQQSPINILRNETVYNPNLKTLKRAYYAKKQATLVNFGNSIVVQWSEGSPGALVLDGKNYNLSQLHWHTPSEHLIDGVQYPAELHMVNKAPDGSLAVVATLFEYGDEDKFIKKITDELAELAKEKCGSHEQAHIPLGKLDTQALRKSCRKYYRYAGSLTTPPCTESVTWTVIAKVRSITKEQVEALKAPLGASYKQNSRPVAPLNGRKIELYDETYKN